MPSNMYKRGEIYWARIQISGRECRQSLRTANRQEAKARLKDLLRELQAPTFYGETRVSWKKACLHYVEAFMPGNVKANTGKRYLVSLRQAGDYLDDLMVDEVDGKVIANFVTKRRLEEVENATIRRDLTAIGNVLRLAKSEHWCLQNAAADYDRLLIKESREPIDLPSDEAVKDAIDMVPKMMGKVMAFAEKTGMRQAEILTLERNQIFRAPHQIRLIRTKTSRPRTIGLEGPLLEEVVAILESVPVTKDSELVFWHGRGDPYRNFSSNFAQQRSSHGFAFRFHDLRHKFAVDYLRLGGNIYDLQLILGHSSVKTTELYLAKLDVQERRKAEDGPGFGLLRSA